MIWGNSMGGLGTYMKLIDKYEMYHGGFIWDFIDQALLVKDEVTGKEVLRYGGDFDDKPSDYEFQEMELYLQTVRKNQLCRK